VSMTLDELRRVAWHRVTSFHMDELRAAFGGKCSKCGALRSRMRGRRSGPLEFAHTKPTGLSGQGRGLQRRFYDVLNNPDCYALLCKRCHVLLDMKQTITRWSRAVDVATTTADAAKDEQSDEAPL